VQPGEGVRAALLLICIFLIMTAYYVMKTAREGLILTGDTFGVGGDELKTYTTGAMAILLLGLVRGYGQLIDHHRRIHVINVSYMVLLSSLVVFYVLARAGLDVGFAYFLWFGLTSALMVAQFWSYASDLYTEEQGKRLFALIATGGTLGAIAGPNIARFAETFNLMLVGGCLLGGAMALFNVIEARSPRERRVREPIEGPDGLALVLGDTGLFAIALLLLLTNVVNSTGEFLLSHAVRLHAIALVPDTAHSQLVGSVHDTLVAAERREIVKQFYSSFFMWVNVLSFVIQLLLVSRIINKIGVRRALFVLPVIAFGAYASIALVGGLLVTRLAKTAENGVDYSLQNTVWQSLFLRTDRATKYKAKATIDTFFVRAGDALSAIIVALGIHKLHFGASDLAFVNLGLIFVWLGVAVWVSHAHRWMGKVVHERATMRRPTGLIYSGEWSSNRMRRGGVSTSSS